MSWWWFEYKIKQKEMPEKVGEKSKASVSFDIIRRIYQYARENKLILDDKSYEFYLYDPRETPKDKLETRVLIHVTRQ